MSIPSPTSSDELATLHDQPVKACQAGQFDMAKKLLDQIPLRDPEHAALLHTCGTLALKAGELELAKKWIEQSIQIRPDPHVYNILHIAQAKLGAFADAIQNAQHAVALEPNIPEFHYNLAVTLEQQDRIEEAATSYRRTLEIEPGHRAARTRLATLAMGLGATDEAEQHFRHALALTPTDQTIRFGLSQALLTAGRYEEGWSHFEARWTDDVNADRRVHALRHQLPLAQWTGDVPNAANRVEKVHKRGARLVVIPEQGYGDNLQFARYLPLALERFSHVGYICPRALRRLYQESLCSRWPGLVLVDPTRGGPRDWDWHCPLMSLPMAFGTRLDNVPARIPYLYAHTRRAARWGTKLATLPEPNMPRIGLVWGGNSGFPMDRERSLTFTQIASLLPLPNLRWISLQKINDPAKRSDRASHARLIDWTDEITDFADTAALIADLDLVISVDTSVAHLAAAMGKPVWLLNRFAGCWRWLRDREDSPWYPTVRIFTQSQRGNWDEVLARVAAALVQHFPSQGRYRDEFPPLVT
jgi:thioredoxin-like negative regulator of GroEL